MRERGDEDGRGIIAVAERSGIEPWRDQFYNEHSDTLEPLLHLLRHSLALLTTNLQTALAIGD
jgi:hypothetical protein